MSVSGGAGQAYEAVFAALARLHRMRCFLHHHSYAYLGKASRLTAILVALAGPSAIHVCLSAGMAGRLRRLYPATGQQRVVSNLGWLKQAGGENPSPKRALATVGFLGNISAEKGVFDFLEVAAALEKGAVPVECKFAGPFQDARTERLVRDALRTLAHTRYVGPKYGDAKAAFFRDIDVLLFPTRYENEAEPLIVLEAMMHGVPVIAYERGCIGEMLAPGGGLIVEPQRNFAEAAMRQLRAWHEAPEDLWRVSRAAIRHSAMLSQRAAKDAEALLTELCGASAGVRLRADLAPHGTPLNRIPPLDSV
jgi:glycosyltransferase involved in cell wall biosynthesis